MTAKKTSQTKPRLRAKRKAPRGKKTAGPTTRARHAAKKVRAGAQEMLAQARWSVMRASELATEEGLRTALERVRTTLSRIEATAAAVGRQRGPALEELASADQQIDQLDEQVDQLHEQLDEKEAEIERLLATESTVEFPPFGSFQVPDVAAFRRAASLLAEVSALYGAIGTAKECLVPLVQSKVALGERFVMTPVEADPRMKELYERLERQTKALAVRNSKAMRAAVRRYKAVFTDADKRKIAKRLGTEIDTGLPDGQQARLFYDAIVKAEKALVGGISQDVLALTRKRKEGYSGNMPSLANDLARRLNAAVEIDGLDKKQQKLFFKRLVALVIEALRKDSDMRSAVAAMAA